MHLSWAGVPVTVGIQNCRRTSIAAIPARQHSAFASHVRPLRVTRGVSQPVRALPIVCSTAGALAELVVQPIKVIEGHVKLPGSKSLSNRILLLAALAEGTTVVENILVSLTTR